MKLNKPIRDFPRTQIQGTVCPHLHPHGLMNLFAAQALIFRDKKNEVLEKASFHPHA
jgi:hypothetical protein